MNVNTWKLAVADEVIAQVLTFVKYLEQHKVTSKALDGSIYIQTVGHPVKCAKVELLASREEKDRFNELEADGSLMSLVYRDKIYYGYVESTPSWSTVYPGKWYSTSIVFLIMDEVDYVETGTGSDSREEMT